MGKKKIIFFKSGDFSHTNHAVRDQLEKNFPEYHVEVCDVFELVEHDLNSVRNKISLMYEYGSDILSKKKYWKSWLFCTSYMFLKIRKVILSAYQNNEEVVFTFQTQSLYDASIPNVPHFVYTDSTVLANYSYPNISPSSFLKSKKWMKLEKEVYNNASKVFLFSTNQVNSVVEDLV